VHTGSTPSTHTCRLGVTGCQHLDQAQHGDDITHHATADKILAQLNLAVSITTGRYQQKIFYQYGL
jgi:hypothetical protein